MGIATIFPFSTKKLEKKIIWKFIVRMKLRGDIVFPSTPSENNIAKNNIANATHIMYIRT